jgi:hypothetical protein
MELFEMMDYKSMATSMMINLKKMNQASSDSYEIDPHVYRQLIGSLMYLVNTRHDICRCKLGSERNGPEEHIRYCFTLGSSMVFWCSRKQSSVALSIAEAKYIALSVVVREAVWLHKILTDLFYHEMDPTTIHCDNQSCVKLSENPVFHDRSKHIEIKYHYIRDMVQRKTIHVQYHPTHEQIADIFTKLLARMKFKYLRERLGLVENTSLAEKEC